MRNYLIYKHYFFEVNEITDNNMSKLLKKWYFLN